MKQNTVIEEECGFGLVPGMSHTLSPSNKQMTKPIPNNRICYLAKRVVSVHRTFLGALLFVAALTFISNVASQSGFRCFAQIPELEVREGAGIPPEVRTIYEKGARYLQTIQQTNGTFGKGQGGFRGGGEESGICALCTMAFLSTGEDPNFGKYAGNIRKSLRYIIRSQNPRTGYIEGNMYCHGFAMLALSEAYGAVDDTMLWAGQKKDKRTRTIGEALELAVRLAVDSQKRNPQKAWRYSPGDGSADTSVAGAVLMGLLAARNAGIAVPDKAIDGALEYMKSMTSDESGQVGYSGLGGLGESSARSSIACLVYAIGKRKHWKEFESTTKYLTDNLEQQGGSSWPYYTRYYRAQALFQSDYDAWKKWNRATIRQLRDMQDDSGRIGKSAHGDAYGTSMSLLALALNYRFLPIYER